MARRTAGGGKIDNGAFDEGSDDAASAARGTAEGGYIVVGTSDEGSDDNEAAESTARRARERRLPRGIGPCR